MPAPQRSSRVPSYRLHKPTGRAVVTICGRDIYCGRYGTPESRADYDRVIAEWLARGRRAPAVPDQGAAVVELAVAFLEHCQRMYQPATIWAIKAALKVTRELYGHTLVAEFGPLSLKAIRENMVGRGWSRVTINTRLSWIRSAFRWGTEEGLVPPSVFHGLTAVRGVRRGRPDVKEPGGVRPVADDVVERTLAELPPVLADMVRIQRLTGARPQEVVRMTTGEIDTSGEVWYYQPKYHKTAHHGHVRSIAIGPRAQAVLRGYLRPTLDAPLFSPAAAEAQRHEQERARRKTPLTPSQRRRDQERARRPRAFNPTYDVDAYRRAICRACDRAGVPRWSPNQLRHTRATEVRRAFGLDAAGAVLGHAELQTTQVYAERNRELSARVALATG